MAQDGAVHSLGETPSRADVEPDLRVVLTRAQAGDEDAFRLLYREIQPGLLRYLRVLAPEDAEDIASEAWLQITKGLTGFRGDIDGFRGWTTTIARNRALDLLRARRRRPVFGGDEHLPELPAREDTAGAAMTSLSTDAALALIAKLPRDQAEAVLLRVVVGLDAPGAAKVLGKRPGAVRTAAYRGLRKLADHLAQAGVTHLDAATLKEVR